MSDSTSSCASNIEMLKREASRHPRPTPEREVELSAIILGETCRDATKAAIDELVNCNIPLVIAYVTRHMRVSPPFSVDEVMAAGLTGLFRAAQDYDASRGRYATYAMRWVRNHIQCYMVENHPAQAVRVPRGETEKRRTVVDGRPNSILARAASHHSATSFNDLFHGADERSSRRAEEAELTARKESLFLSMLSAASQRERAIIKMYYGISRQHARPTPTLSQIGDTFGISRQRAQQLIAKGIKKSRIHPKELECFGLSEGPARQSR